MSSKLIVNSIENTTGTHTINLDSGNSSIVGDLTVGGDLTATGVTMTGDFLPNADNASDLGSTAKRFQNLHLSGGVSFDEDPSLVAGSVSSKTLDDYEEGTYTGTMTPFTSGTITLSASGQTLNYVKVGSLVTVTGYLAVASVSSPLGRMRINLPFAAASGVQYRASVNLKVNAATTGPLSEFWGVLDGGLSALDVYLATGSSTNVSSDSAQRMKTGSDMRISVSYRTA